MDWIDSTLNFVQSGNSSTELTLRYYESNASSKYTAAFDNAGDLLVNIMKDAEENEVDNETSIPAKEMVPLFQCSRCGDIPMTSPIHMCTLGHHTCHVCFKHFNRECITCGETLSGRNKLLESVTKNMCQTTAAALSKAYKLSILSEDDTLYEPSLLAKLDRACQDSLLSHVRRQSVSEVRLSSSEVGMVATKLNVIAPIFRRLSHKPVQCPFVPCGRVVAANGFIHHFEIEHPIVPIIHMTPEESPFGLTVFPGSVFRYTHVRSLSIFAVPFPCESFSSDHASKGKLGNKNSVICVLTAAKYMITSPAERPIGEYGDSEIFDFSIGIWVSCLYEEPPLMYEIRIHNSKSATSHILNYTGPVTSLHYSQEPWDVLRRGDCLCIPAGVLQKICYPSSSYDLQVSFTFKLPAIIPSSQPNIYFS